MVAIDEQKLEEAVGKVFGELGAAVTGPLIVLGDRLGLWPAMAGETRIRQVLADAGFTQVRRVAQQAATFNIVQEARP
jgi:hypothetical protein